MIANLHFVLKTNPTAYSCRLQGFLTVPGLAVSQPHVVWSFTGLNRGEQQLKSNVCRISEGHSSMERRSGDVCLKTSFNNGSG